jgi:hypothetical protein
LPQCAVRGLFPGMSTLQEIEAAVEALPPAERKALLRHLTAKVRSPVRRAVGGKASRWPVAPPKVSKAESRRIEHRIETEFGRVEWENWK